MKRTLGVLLALSLLVSPAFAATVSFDQLATSADLTVAKFNADLDRIYVKVNANIQTDNIANDTLTEADMADEINPRIRTYENFGEYVDDGLLQTTTSGTLTGTIPAGTAYPRGYRIDKTSGTSKTYAANTWTYADIDINGDFQYSEVAIGAAAPAIAANSVRLFRASTDGTQVVDVQDLRILNPAAAFANIVDVSGEATLEDIFNTGSPHATETVGLIRGCQVSFDTHTSFKVLRGVAWVNGHIRRVSSDVTVNQIADDPTQGGSGLDTGAISASTTYNVFLVADQSNVKTWSISFSTGAAPTGITNYRKIGQIKTDASSLFISQDVLSSHSYGKKEIVAGWICFDGTGSSSVKDSHNVSSLVDYGTADYGITWDKDFPGYANRVSYCWVVTTKTAGTDPSLPRFERVTGGELRFQTVRTDTFASQDANYVNVIAYGEQP